MESELKEEQVKVIKLLIESIPQGTVATYGQIAELAGLPRHARYVGYILRNTMASEDLPWHRVVRADGRIAERFSATEQITKLRREAVNVSNGRVNLRRFQWQP